MSFLSRQPILEPNHQSTRSKSHVKSSEEQQGNEKATGLEQEGKEGIKRSQEAQQRYDATFHCAEGLKLHSS
jgi:hypothetical protein